MEYLLYAGFVILNYLDVVTTNKILKMGGFEANPIVRLLMRFHLFIPAKIALTIFVGMAILLSDSPDNLYLAIFCCVFYALLVANNLFQIHRGMKWMNEEEA
ncbi:MAG TPA: DUF5658 family protein [Smithellaceae bacterium]|nr:DUF5658 family protein [Smithellaceae bacterium]